METSSDRQNTLTAFFTPTNAARVWRIILAVLTTLMVIGAAYMFSKPKPEPVRMAYETENGSYVYLDVQLLSDWIYEVSGDENYTFYEAMDADGNWFILSLNQKTFDSMQTYVDAYNAYFTDDYMNYDYPEVMRLNGMTRPLDSSDTAELADYYDTTIAEFIGFFGVNYVDIGANNAYDGAIVFVAGAVVFGLFLLAVSAQIAGVQRNYRKSDAHLFEAGLADEAEAQFNAQDSIRFDKAKLVAGRDFLYCGASGWMLPYTEIGWLYLRKQRSYGITVSTSLMAGHVNGKSIVIANRAVNDETIMRVAQAALAKNPLCLIGYSFDNLKLYKLRVNAYKQANPK